MNLQNFLFFFIVFGYNSGFATEKIYCHFYIEEIDLTTGKSKKQVLNKIISQGEQEEINFLSPLFSGVNFKLFANMSNEQCKIREEYKVEDISMIREDECSLVNFNVTIGWYSQNKVSLKSGCILSYQKDFDKAQLVAQEQEYQESRGYLFYAHPHPKLSNGIIDFHAYLDGKLVFNESHSTENDSNLPLRSLAQKFDKNEIEIYAGDFDQNHKGVSSSGGIVIKKNIFKNFFIINCDPISGNKKYKYLINFQDKKGKKHDIEYIVQCKMKHYEEIKINPNYQKEVEKKALSKENKK
jgi:hypothetical protein